MMSGVQYKCEIIIIITKECDYGGVMSRGLQGHLTNEIVILSVRPMLVLCPKQDIVYIVISS